MVRNNKKKLSEETAENILKLITNMYHEGDQIPNEMELASQLQVSRTTVREAVNFLCAINVLEIKRGKGTFIRENPGMVKDPLGYRFIDKEKLVVDLYEMRLIFEPEIAALAAEKATPAAIEKLQAASRKLQEDMPKYESGKISMVQLLQGDMNFHRAVVDCCDNKVMGRILPIITHGLMELYSGRIPLSTLFGRDDHACICEAIASRDSVRARQFMRQHILDVKNVYECMFPKK